MRLKLFSETNLSVCFVAVSCKIDPLSSILLSRINPKVLQIPSRASSAVPTNSYAKDTLLNISSHLLFSCGVISLLA